MNTKEKKKNAKKSTDVSLTVQKNNLISKYNLIEYDLYIKSESYNTEYFIHDVENIILKQKK